MSRGLARPVLIWIDSSERMPNDDEIDNAPGGTFLCRVLKPDGKGRGRVSYRVCDTDYDYGRSRHFNCPDAVVLEWTMIPADPRN